MLVEILRPSIPAGVPDKIEEGFEDFAWGLIEAFNYDLWKDKHILRDLIAVIESKDSVPACIDVIVANGGQIVQPIGGDAPEITARFRDPGGNVIGIFQQG